MKATKKDLVYALAEAMLVDDLETHAAHSEDPIRRRRAQGVLSARRLVEATNFGTVIGGIASTIYALRVRSYLKNYLLTR